MTRKSWFLVAIAALLGGVYLYFFTDFINTPAIQIIKSDRPVRSGRPGMTVYPISFTLDGRYELTSVKVVSAAEYATNKHAKPLWELVSRGHSEAVKGFLYGQTIRGMEPALTNARPARLAPGVPYRLLVAAGRARGEIDFKAAPVANP